MMNNEEFDRKMEFIINQQARFDANIQHLQEGHKELQQLHKATDGKLNRLADTTSGLRESITELRDLTHEGFKLLFESSKRLDERFKRLDESSKNTDAKINALVDAQIRTDEMLRNTDEMIRNIGTKLDRHLKEDHNGSQS